MCPELIFRVCFSRDGPDHNSPQLGVFSGNTALETAYSSTNQVLLKFHSDFSTGGFFVLNFHGQFVLYDQCLITKINKRILIRIFNYLQGLPGLHKFATF